MCEMPWEVYEGDWFPLPTRSKVPQKTSKTNFKAFGFYVFGDIDIMRLVLSVGRSLAFSVSFGVGKSDCIALLYPTCDRPRHSQQKSKHKC